MGSQRKYGASPDTEAMSVLFVSTSGGVRHTHCDGPVTLPSVGTALQYRALSVLFVANSAQVPTIVRVAAPVVSAVARAWGLF